MSKKTFDGDLESGSETDNEERGIPQYPSSDDDVNEDEDNALLVPSDDPDLSDDAPEDIGFSQSKEAVLQTVKNTLELIRQNKEQLKGKRREKDELFKSQKKQKLESIASRRLPDDILDAIPSGPIKKKKEVDLDTKDKEVTDDHDVERLDVEDPMSGSDPEFEQSEFVPLERDAGITAVCVAEEVKKTKSSMETALAFRHGKLHAKDIPRETVQQSLGKKAKRRARPR